MLCTPKVCYIMTKKGNSGLTLCRWVVNWVWGQRRDRIVLEWAKQLAGEDTGPHWLSPPPNNPTIGTLPCAQNKFSLVVSDSCRLLNWRFILKSLKERIYLTFQGMCRSNNTNQNNPKEKRHLFDQASLSSTVRNIIINKKKKKRNSP